MMSHLQKVFPVEHAHVAVLDTARGLMWAAQDALPEAATLAEAEAAVKSMTLLGHKDWRLPTIQELQSLVDFSRHEPAIDTALFPTCKSEWYWTATPVAWRSGARWVVDFNGGHSGSDDDDVQARVRAVRSAVPGQ